MSDELELALLVGVDTGEDDNFDRSMEELQSLAKACNMEVAGITTQSLEDVNKAFYIGRGKVEEVKEYAHNLGVDIVIFDNTLTPSQLRNLQRELECPVMDRTALILEIFSSRARTREAKLQVECARLSYLMSRLVGMHEALTRQGGSSGSQSSRGAGEKKLELDRRRIEHRIAELNRELADIEKERTTQRKRRVEAAIPKVALVGYTNSGKSTIMNRLVEQYVREEDKKVLEKDMLFATLDTTVRKISTGNNQDFLLSDTVGFIHKLPHGLVKAFRSTLEEAVVADLLLYVIDYSDEEYRHQIQVTRDTLKELNVGDVPVLYVFNKADKVEGCAHPKVYDDRIYMSALSQEGMDELVRQIILRVYGDFVECEFLIPYQLGNITSYLQEHAIVEETDYRQDGTYLKVRCHKKDVSKYREYVMKS